MFKNTRKITLCLETVFCMLVLCVLISDLSVVSILNRIHYQCLFLYHVLVNIITIAHYS